MLPFPVEHPKTRAGTADAIVIGFLENDRIVSFVQRVRAREGIVPPESPRELKYNLRRHPPDQFLSAARLRVKRVLACDQHLWCFLLGGAILPSDASPQGKPKIRRALQELFLQASGLQSLIPQLARVVARYIVAGLLEVPKVSVSIAGVVYTVHTTGEPMVVAIATAGTDLDDLIRLLRKQWRAEFLPRRRDRAPDTLTQGLWLRHCKRVLERDRDDEGTSYRRLAELSFAIWPQTRPHGEPLEPHYERALQARAEQIRKSMEAVEGWKKTILDPPSASAKQQPET